MGAISNRRRVRRLDVLAFTDHFGRVASWLLLLAILAGTAWLYMRAVRPSDYLAWEDCRAAYARAATATDSLLVDQRRPIHTRGDAEAAVTCRVLRESGQFR